MRRLSRSGAEKSIAEVWQWFEDTSSALRRDEQTLVAMVHSPGGFAVGYERYVGFSPADIQEHYSDLARELDLLTNLDLLSAAEAALRVDYLDRVWNRSPRDERTRLYQAIHGRVRNEQRNRVRLDEDILEAVRESAERTLPSLASEVGEFRGALRLRHWLAHGRYWNPKLGQVYDPQGVHRICFQLLNALRLT